MDNLALEIRVLENGTVVKEIAIFVEKLNGTASSCRPSVKIKDCRSGFEGSVRLPEGEYGDIKGLMEKISKGKLNGEFVFSIVRKISSLFERR